MHATAYFSLTARPHGLSLLAAVLLSLSLTTAAVAKPMGAQGENFLYQVEPGDTLEQLAQRYTLNRDHWRLLQTLNQVADPYQLPIGQVLRIPLNLIPRQPAQATVVHVSGVVTRDGQGLHVGDTIETGQTIQSQASGSVTLRLTDDSLLTLPPDATVHLKNLQTFQGSQLNDSVLDMPDGELDAVVAPHGNGVGRFEVRTPSTVTGVRGTQLRVRTDARGSRHELTQGQAVITGDSHTEATIRPNSGAAYRPDGTLIGTATLLPAPTLRASTTPYTLDWEPLAGAAAYRVRVALDPQGTQLESTQQYPQAPAQLTFLGAGPRYLFVRAIDALGIEGQDASATIEVPFGLRSSDGQPVRNAYHEPIGLAYDH